MQRKSTDRGNTRQATTREFHNFQFRNPTVPGGWLDLLLTGKITRNQFLLTVIIDCYVKRNGPGCWASNSHLGNLLQISPHAASQIIKQMVRVGYIKRVLDGEQRSLEAYWSRCDTPPPAPYGEQKDSSTNGASAHSTTGATISIKKDEVMSSDTTYQKTKEPASPASHGNSPRSTTQSSNHTLPVRNGGSMPTPSMDKKCPPSKQSKPSKPSASEDDLTVSKEIRDYVVRTHGEPPPTDNKWHDWECWEGAIARLRLRLQSCATQIDTVLDYLVRHHPKDAKPKIHNAKHFANCFEWLQGEAQKYQTKNPNVVITSNAKKIAARLGTDWPKGADTRVAMTVQLSLDAYQKFYEVVCSVSWVSDRKDIVARFSSYLMSGGMPPAADYVEEQYMRLLYRRLVKWKDWRGDLIGMAFDPNKPEFQAEGRGWASDWCGDPDVWDQLVKEVKERQYED